MMGHQSDSQDKLFYSFNLDDHVPQNHLLRGINQFLDLSDLRQHLTQFYSHTGRPSIDPELMIRMSNGVQYFPSNSVHICQWSFKEPTSYKDLCFVPTVIGIRKKKWELTALFNTTVNPCVPGSSLGRGARQNN